MSDLLVNPFRFGAAAFSPLDVSGLVAWWDASNAGSITSSGGAVSQWNDLSASGTFDLTQSTAEAKPTTGGTTLNGLNVLTFDGGDCLSYAGDTGLDVGAATVFVVGYESSAVDNAGFFSAHHSSGNDYDDQRAIAFNTGAAGNSAQAVLDRYLSDGATQAKYLGSKPTPVAVWVARLSTAPLLEVFKNGGTPSTGTRAGTWNTAQGGYLVGGRYLAGISALYRLNGAIAEIVVYNSTLSASNVNLVGNHLGTKWNQTWSNIS